MDADTIRRSVRWLRTLSFVVGAAVLIEWLIFFGMNQHSRSQARLLVTTLLSMSDSARTLDEFRPILAHYRADTIPAYVSAQRSADVGFNMSLGNHTIPNLRNRFYFFHYIGLAPWGAGAEIYFKNGRLCDLRFSFGTEIREQDQVREGFTLTTEEAFPGKNEYGISGGHLTWNGPYFVRVYVVTVPADSTLAERAHAFAYDFSCVTRLGGCRDVSQVLALRQIRQDVVARHSD